MKFQGMYCIAHASVLRIEANGRCKGMVCGNDKVICDIYGKDIRGYILNKNNEAVNYVMNEMNNGFSSVLVNKGDESMTKNVLHFLCIDGYVEIKVKR